ncbi:carboxypeptidase-like regulatory domain-containing protein, partial [bacterium]|nr:carboxypeptidase-like regulatory domain-containing protein [bacterium]
MNRKLSVFILLICIFLPILLPAQDRLKGRIEGVVIDGNDGEPLPGVNVMLKGTYMGAATDMAGRFFIRNINPGFYDIEVSMIGYKIQLRTGVKVVANESQALKFGLEESVLAFGQEVVVVGKKPLLQVDLTASETSFSADDLSNKIVENVDDIISQQAGVVKSDNQIHIRGGRADESLYIVNGVSVKDPLSGYGNTLYVNSDAIKELKIITGGFNAEYGQAMSGVIDVVTKDGDEDYHGGITYKSDNLGLGITENYNTQIMEFSFGGPEPLSGRLLPGIGLDIPGSVTFFVSGYGNISDTYLPTANKLAPSRKSLDKFAMRQENDWHILG